MKESEFRALEDTIRKHQYLYYVLNKPEISDKEFDSLFQKLIDLEKKFPNLVSPNSPTKMVGSDLSNEFEKFTHKIPVLSLENTYSTNELLEWATKTGLDEEYSVEWKVDGASIVLYYESGQLETCVSRGTGGVGDNITENIRTVKNIPLVLPKPLTLYVRGEVYMNFSDFEEFNSTQGGRYANPRNLTSGTIKHKNSSQVAKRPLRIVTYDGFLVDKKKIKTHKEMLSLLEEMRLPVSTDNQIVKGKKLSETIEKFHKKKDSLGYPTDGLVVKLNDLGKRLELGETTHSPRWARALKFDALMKESIVKSIDFAVGRTGKITPRAEIEPIQLAGTTVRYATLHNQDYINELGVGIGATVKVAKRGEIIPAVEEVVIPPKEVFQIPEKCPSCGTKTIYIDDSVDKFCPNKKCPAREMNGLIFFCQKKQMDIEGLGDKQIENFYNEGIIKSIPDIYDLHKKKSELEVREGLGEKSVKIILEGIEKSKEKDLLRILPSLGLHEVGHKVTELLIENDFDSIDSIISEVKKKDAREKFLSIHGLGDRTVDAIIQQFQDKELLKLISELKKRGLNFNAKKKEKSSNEIFKDQIWCVTGSFENFNPREKAMTLVEFYGGKKTGSISNKTTHLLAGDGAGSKLEKAISLGIKIVTEEEFLQLLKQAGYDT
ncbi:MAG: NAD-dependent DNA ligase LigA [Leptospiraceae bacterium]|nr:NAD-dependent DNA ligase LigA [Leptospiraceae bacterium]